ncbi:MAG: hypothetical protein FWH31_00410 [Streptococcaceae bacterium]|uniref:Uncharacterized protein n=1 Tax=Lactococcus allomyrinae TaxID=2419773 RepID=A0A387BKI3_9LACT|nr:hypothetical protein [Lactococcus allomyrinae]AYG01526.1 hypothetical protein D7I46_10910 [Lactococcus allomyrinae]MCL2112392.1 hypothetical protein [Streptococcaceae bacterium]
MIIVNLAQRQEEIIALLESKGYHFVKKQGIKLSFEVPEGTEDLNAAAVEVKALIKGTEWGPVLYFNVVVA